MAVWSSTTFKLDYVQKLWEIDERLPGKAFGGSVGDYLNPNAELSGLSRDMDWDDVADRLAWRNDHIDDMNDDDFTELLGGVTNYVVGTPAIYRIIKAVADGRFDIKPNKHWTDIEDRFLSLWDTSAMHSFMNPAKFRPKWFEEDYDAMKASKKYEDAAEAFKFMRFAFNRRGRGKKSWYEELNQTKYFGKGRRVWYGGTYNGLLFLRGAAEYVQTCLVISRQALDHVIGAFYRLAGIHEYLATEYADDPYHVKHVMDAVEESIQTAATVGKTLAYKVAKAYHKSKAFAQMKFLETLIPEAYDLARKEYTESSLQDIIPIEHLWEKLDGVSRDKYLDVLVFYRWMPPPDYDPTRCFAVQRDIHYNPRGSGASPNASPEMKELWEAIKFDRKINTLAAYRSQFADYPPNLVKVGEHPKLSEIKAWEPNCTFPYTHMGTQIANQVKDKAIPRATAASEIAGKGRVKEKSYLLWYLANAKTFDSRTELREFASGRFDEENYVRADYKAESHKDESRLFYLAPPKTRLLLSELEGNLSKVAATYPGSLQGKSTSAKATLMAKVFDNRQFMESADASYDYTVCNVTFDLSKFSGKADPAITQDYHEYWAKAFGVPEISNLGEIGTTAKILHTKCGIVASYQNRGADLEGFRGRMMTMFHSDMMGAACRLARKKGVIVSKGVLATFIDDGACKIAVKGKGEVAKANAVEFLRIMQKVYAAAGQDNNPAKTVVSMKGGDILASTYYNGQVIPAGMKAAMKSFPSFEGPVTTLSEDMDAIFATNQGAIKDGCKWIPAYKRYIRGVIKTIFRWAPREASIMDHVDFKLKLMTPKSYGGFGVMPIQALTTTCAYNATSEGLGMLMTTGRMFADYRKKVKGIVKQPVIIREPLGVLRDPLRIRTTAPVLSENRLVKRILAMLESKEEALAEYVTLSRVGEIKDHAIAVASAILSNDTVSAPLIQRAWRATPLYQVETILAKFKRAASLMALGGAALIGSVRRANKADVQAILGHIP